MKPITDDMAQLLYKTLFATRHRPTLRRAFETATQNRTELLADQELASELLDAIRQAFEDLENLDARRAGKPEPYSD